MPKIFLEFAPVQFKPTDCFTLNAARQCNNSSICCWLGQAFMCPFGKGTACWQVDSKMWAEKLKPSTPASEEKAPDQVDSRPRQLKRKPYSEYKAYEKVLVRTRFVPRWMAAELGCIHKGTFFGTAGLGADDFVPYEGNEWAWGKETDSYDYEIMQDS